MSHLISFLVAIMQLLSSTVHADCTISINDLSEKSPLILRRSGNKFKFYVPNVGDKIVFSEKQSPTLACPGNKITIKGEESSNEIVKTRCKLGKFEIGGYGADFKDISCKARASTTARYTGKHCLKKHREIETGFLIDRTFLRIVLICFNDETQITLYSQFTLEHSVNFRKIYYPRVSWKQGIFYNLTGDNLYNLYKVETQRATVNNLLGLPITSEKYINEKDYYLAKGHLAAKADYLYAPQQHATFYFVNAIPQWQKFNADTWLKLEKSVRRYAMETSKNLTIYTGTHGVTSLPYKDTSKRIPLYLYAKNGTKLVPVPRLLWKIIYDSKEKRGIVCVGVNNVFVLDKEKDIICDNICHRYKCLEWCQKPIDPQRGYLYCCKIDEFRKTVKTVPRLQVIDILDVYCSGIDKLSVYTPFMASLGAYMTL